MKTNQWDSTRIKRWESPRTGPTRPTKGRKRPQALRHKRKARSTFLGRLQAGQQKTGFFITQIPYPGKIDTIVYPYLVHTVHKPHSSSAPSCIHDTKQAPSHYFQQTISID
jgi:hypothetical protein